MSTADNTGKSPPSMDLRDRGGAALLHIFLGVLSHVYLEKRGEKRQHPAFVLIETAVPEF